MLELEEGDLQVNDPQSACREFTECMQSAWNEWEKKKAADVLTHRQHYSGNILRTQQHRRKHARETAVTNGATLDAWLQPPVSTDGISSTVHPDMQQL
jgi:hypothetical protein